MGKVLIIGAGGIGGVVAHKCAQHPEVFSEIVLASRTKSKCDAIAAQLKRPVKTAQVNADNVPELVALIKKEKPDVVLNVALPYQDLHIMDACLETGVNYLDTANYEPEDTARFEYSWQWAYQERFRKAGIMALSRSSAKAKPLASEERSKERLPQPPEAWGAHQRSRMNLASICQRSRFPPANSAWSWRLRRTMDWREDS